ncbi:hypothetical protein BASA81_014332 [Batrachochytrium salamandrivorans]|nr:hypothetical protein BASA81_014332 [Batrachochytrium salamandrivorans]
MILGTVLASSLAILFRFYNIVSRTHQSVQASSVCCGCEYRPAECQSLCSIPPLLILTVLLLVASGSAVSCGEGDTKDTVIQTVFLQTRGKNTAGIVAIQPSSKTIVVAFRGAVEFQIGLSTLDLKNGPHLGLTTELSQPIANGYLFLTISRFTVDSTSLAAADYVNHESGDTSYVSVYSYGEPRIGNSQWADWFDNLPLASYRVTSQSDPVPRLPPYIMGYRHTKQEYFITSDKVTETCTNSGVAGETTDCSTETLFSVGVYAHIYGYYWPSGGRDFPDS